jgi:predicted ATPase/DNA-binding CsgD family transcriptional regulator
VTERGGRERPGFLPSEPTPFIGRRTELAEVRRLLTSSRVVTLSGLPGVGKTRLALRAAKEARRRFPDGVWWTDLVGLRDSSLLAQEIAGVLGLHDGSTQWIVETLAQHMSDKKALIALDNCEHLIDACAVLVDSLQRSCPRVQVLTTSRQSLSIGGESVLRVPPLSVPEVGVNNGEAMELLFARARAVTGASEVPGRDRPAAGELCRRLEGIPLAIELAAVRLKTLSMEQVLERLDDRFGLLGAGDRAAPLHRRTLHATFHWSYELVSEEERTLWQRLSVFPATFDISAAQAVCVGDPLSQDRLLDALDGLVDKSLLDASQTATTMRYRMLQSLREFGLEKLPTSGEEDRLRRAHRDHFGALCREAGRHWADSSQPFWFDVLRAEHDNLRVALDWCLKSGEPAIGSAMASDMWLYWQAAGYLTEGRRRLAALVDTLPPDDPTRPRALWVLAFLALGQTDVVAALPLLHRCLEAANAIGDDESVAFATQYLGLAQLFQGDLGGAAERLEEAFARHRQRGDRLAAFALSDLGVAVMLSGDLERAVRIYEHALSMTEPDGDPWTRGHCLWGLGVARWMMGDNEEAEVAEIEAIRLLSGLGEGTGVALCLDALAWTSASQSEFERSARLQGTALAAWESVPRQRPEPVRPYAARCEEMTQSGIGTDRWGVLIEEGRRLEPAAAVTLAMREEGSAATNRRTGGSGSTLTERELQVAELVAKGMTDREIAAELVISQRTAESHVQHILTKLGFRSRAQIAAWVATSR